MMNKAIMSVLTVWILLCSMFIGLISFSDIENVKAPYTPHNPIRINNNTEFASMAGIEGWVGDGSPGNPYTIEGYDINGSGYGYCIFIGNTTVYFEVRDCYLHEASGVYSVPYSPLSGIKLYNVQNGLISNNNVFSNTYDGINIDDSNSITIANNNISSNTLTGIFFYASNNITIVNNTLSLSNWYGIALYASSSNTIIDNEMTDNGIFIEGSTLEHWNSHIIDTTNTVNEKPINYMKNQTGGTAPLGSGQVILANCTDMKVEDQNVSDCSVGINLGFSSNIIIANNTAYNNWDGIYLCYSSNNTITNNNVSSNNRYGIYLSHTNNNTITNNKASSNDYYSIYLSFSINNNITNNEMTNNGIIISGNLLEYWNTHTINTTNTINGKTVHYLKNINGSAVPMDAGQVILANCTNVIVDNQNVSNCSVGILLGFSTLNKIANNTACSNIIGISLYQSNNNTIINNNASNNWRAIYLQVNCNGNIIKYNTLSKSKYGFLQSSSYSNMIFNNNIIENTYQAVDSINKNNQYDMGYPSGGNYWSDYIGVDNFKGQYQDIPGSDGIGDTPYIIDADSQDNYPLMQPYKPLENYTILKQGWNLISIPLIQEEKNLTRVLGSIDSWYDAVQWYNNSDLNDLWKHHKVSKPFGNDLSKLNETMSFWIHITNPGDTIFLYNGTQPTSNQSIPLHPGWNMVGYPSLTNRNRTTALNNLTFGLEVDAIWTFNAANKNWLEINGEGHFEVGKGYWIHATTECVWEVPL